MNIIATFHEGLHRLHNDYQRKKYRYIYILKITTIFGYNVSAVMPCLRHMERAQSAQFYAPTKASMKEFRLYPIFILRLFVLGKGMGH